MSWPGVEYVADRLLDQIPCQHALLWVADDCEQWHVVAARSAPTDADVSQAAVVFGEGSVVARSPGAVLAVDRTGDPLWVQACLTRATPALTAPIGLERARRDEAMLAGVLEAISDEAAILDQRGVVVRANRVWQQAPASHRAVMERSCVGSDYLADLRAQDSRSAHLAADGIAAVLSGSLPSFQADYDTDIYAGDRSFSLHVDPLPAAGAVVRHLDISIRKHLQRELAHRATHDPLTGLPNRMVLIDRLGQAMIRAARTSRRLAVMFCDVDRFKQINDARGHSAGDRVLSAVARRLQNSVAQSDLVARFGGDEFVVLLDNIDDADSALQIAQRLQSAATRPILEEGHELTFGLSIGIAVHAGAVTPEPAAISDLLSEADAAMYAAKASGRGGIHLTAAA